MVSSHWNRPDSRDTFHRANRELMESVERQICLRNSHVQFLLTLHTHGIASSTQLDLRCIFSGPIFLYLWLDEWKCTRKDHWRHLESISSNLRTQRKAQICWSTTSRSTFFYWWLDCLFCTFGICTGKSCV